MTDRSQFRADWHDYNGGIYFVTVCCKDKSHYFGAIENGEIILSIPGMLINRQIEELPTHFHGLEVLNHVIMPNHIHLVLSVSSVPPCPPVGTLFKASATATGNTASENTATSMPEKTTHLNLGCLKPKMHGHITADFHHNSTLSIIMRSLKGGVTRECGRRNIEFAWQPRYHEHIIRNQQAFDNIMNYVDNNVDNWNRDCFNAG